MNTYAVNRSSMIKKGRFSMWIRLISYIIDLCIIFGLSFIILLPYIDLLSFSFYLAIAWSALSIGTRFYHVYRYTHLTDIFSLVTKQSVLFALVLFAYFGYHTSSGIHVKTIWWYVLLSIFVVMTLKLILFFILKPYRRHFKGNLRKVVILGRSQKSEQLASFFNTKQEYGYDLRNIFDVEVVLKDNAEGMRQYILENDIEEIYISLGEVNNSFTQELMRFADNNLIVIKFLPDNANISSYKLKMEHYGVLPIVSIRRIPVNEPINQLVKRSFDLIFSSLVLVGVFSWLVPIIALIIKLESKGPVFFKQKRIGLDYQKFTCYKFRSMHVNPNANLTQATKGDSRITKFGVFLRKTSMDELPQFINVFLGNMSVVGPRPLMVRHTHMYAERVNKFMVRHLVKPGITGLAQVSGFRGEVENDADIINRVKYDIFYLENWSGFLDLKIIFMTVYNIIKGEDKAY